MMATTPTAIWPLIRRRLATIKPGEIAQLFADVMGDGPWLITYSDWLRRWGFDGDCGSEHVDGWSDDAVRTSNIEAFLRDAMTPGPSDAESLAILTAIRSEYLLRPRDGTGRTSAEVLGLIRQAIREHAIQRAAAARHQGRDGEAAFRGGMLPSADAAIVALCCLTSRLSERLAVPGDCFCGRHEKAQSEPSFDAFETGFRFSPDIITTLERLIEAVPQQEPKTWPDQDVAK